MRRSMVTLRHPHLSLPVIALVCLAPGTLWCVVTRSAWVGAMTTSVSLMSAFLSPERYRSPWALLRTAFLIGAGFAAAALLLRRIGLPL